MKRGFSLIELLVAIAVVAVIGGAVFSVLLSAFNATESGNAKSAVVVADDFDIAFSRDYESAVAPLGFAGDASSCSFSTTRPTTNGTELVFVEYRPGANGEMACVSTPYPTNGMQNSTLVSYPGLGKLAFAYGDTNAPLPTVFDSLVLSNSVPRGMAIDFRKYGIRREYARRAK